jgi:heme exporter protein B
MKNFIEIIASIVWKDLISELRTKEVMIPILIFSIMVIFVFNFALGPGFKEMMSVVPGVLWVTFIFAGTLGMNRSMSTEMENECIKALCMAPVDKSLIYLGKFIGNLIFLLITETIILIISVVLFNYQILDRLHALVPVIILGTIGFVGVGTLLAMISVQTRLKEIVLPILLLPVIIPVIIWSANATRIALSGKAFAEVVPYLELLLAFDIIFLIISLLTFEYLLQE